MIVQFNITPKLNALLKFLVDSILLDKSEVENQIASVSERNSEPRRGAIE